MAKRLTTALRRAFPTGQWASPFLVVAACTAHGVRGTPRGPVLWADAAQIAGWVREGRPVPIPNQRHHGRWAEVQRWAEQHRGERPWRRTTKAILDDGLLGKVPTSASYTAMVCERHLQAGMTLWQERFFGQTHFGQCLFGW